MAVTQTQCNRKMNIFGKVVELLGTTTQLLGPPARPSCVSDLVPGVRVSTLVDSGWCSPYWLRLGLTRW